MKFSKFRKKVEISKKRNIGLDICKAFGIMIAELCFKGKASILCGLIFKENEKRGGLNDGNVTGHEKYDRRQ